MNELNLYMTFQNILSKSSVIDGNFTIVPGYGADLNFEQAGETIINVVKPKRYPLVALFPPVEVIRDNVIQYKLKFIFCVQTGNGSLGIKDIKSNNTSGHPIIYDWKDMRECAVNFFQVISDLGKITPKPFNVTKDSNYIERFSEMGTAKLSGVVLSFDFTILNNTKCENSEYSISNLKDLLSLDNIHPQHKH